jgi:hypothetical protein
MLQFVSRSFPAEHSLYLRSEPMVPYNVDLYSVGYPRGNEVTLDQYLGHAETKPDLRLLSAIGKNLKINLIFNKPQVPVFCNGSDIVTVTVTSDQEKDWLWKTLWSKHFLEDGDTIRYLPSDPDYCSFYSLAAVLTFNNPYRFSKAAKEELYNSYVVHNHTNHWYFDPDKFVHYDTQHQHNNIFIRLEEILVAGKFLSAIAQIFQRLGLGNPDLDLISQMHEIWLSRQIPYER